MAKLYEGIPNYVKLDDDVSFQLVRTNPRLTSNTKLVYDGKRIYMDSYDASDQLNTMKYKNRSVNISSFFNRDLKNFLVGTGDNAYEVGREMDDITIGRDYDLQFENMYWCGAESINSEIYPQELGFIAPLYIRKKLPNYFVIFKVEGPANTNMRTGDDKFDFKEDVLHKATIIKTFDLREGTVMGDYLRRYVGQKDFKYDQSMYVNMSSQEAWFYGIEKSTGLLCKKVEKFDKTILNRDTTIMYSDQWFTEGFMRNNLIFPYIINLEFLFDDEETPVYEFVRYFGVYCNDIDMYDVNVVSSSGNRLVLTDTYDIKRSGDERFWYIKDKDANLYGIKKSDDYSVTLGNTVDGDFDISGLTGFENATTTANCWRAEDLGHASYAFAINKRFEQGEGFSILVNGEPICENGFIGSEFKYDIVLSESDSDSEYDSDYEIVETQLKERTCRGNIFSINGDLVDIAHAICESINNLDTGTKVVTASYRDNRVVIRCMHSGAVFNDMLSIRFDDELIYNGKVTMSNEDGKFYGGSSDTDSRFKIYAEDSDIFKVGRYIRTTDGSVAQIEYVSPFINSDYLIDKNFCELILSNGKNVDISATHTVEILDKFYPTVGVLSMFPVRDFNFSTSDSMYGDDTEFRNQCMNLKDNLYNEDDGNDDAIRYTLEKDYIEVNGNGIAFERNESMDFEKNKTKYFAWYNKKKTSTEYNNTLYTTTDNVGNIFVVYYFDGSKILKLEANWEIVSPSDSDYISLQISQYTDDNLSHRMNDENGSRITSEYDYFVENYLPELCTVSKTSPYITKWCFYDEQKDGCGNPYRLNVSKIFGRNNLSPNVKDYSGKMSNYAHHLPYYLNEGSGLGRTEVYDSKVKTLEEYIEAFQSTETDEFDRLFNRRVNNSYGISSTLYSRVNFGDADIYPSVLFKGVKFIVSPIENGVEGPSSKYNGYRFSMMYVPSASGMFSDKITFIKNDTFKFIVGLIQFDIKVPSYMLKEGIDIDTVFSPAIAYAGCDDMLPKPVTSIDDKNIRCIEIDFDDYTSIVDSVIRDRVGGGLILKNNAISETIKSSNYLQGGHGTINITVQKTGYSSPQKISSDDLEIDTSGDSVILRFKDEGNIKPTSFPIGNNVGSTMKLKIKDENTSVGNESKLYENYYGDFNLISAYGIKNNLDENRNVVYSSDDFRISIEAPSEVEAFDALMSIPVEVTEKTYNQIGSLKVSARELNKIRVMNLNRYSGYYNPIFQDVLFYKDLDGASYSNTGFDTSVSTFGMLEDVYFHKINKEYANTILSLAPYYPALNQYAIDKRDYNIFSSSWDRSYFTTQLDLNTYRREDNVCGMMNELCMFGSKYLHLPEEIYIDTLEGSADWEDEFYKGTRPFSVETMQKEIGNTTVNFYLFLHKRIVRYFKGVLKDTFSKYLSEAYSYGDTSTLDDDIEEYVEKNILKLYKLDEVDMWVQAKRLGINDGLIENDYESALGKTDSTRKAEGFTKQKAANLQKLTTDSFDRKVVYSLKSGYKETFGFSFRIRKI